jgi:hypothetical protein
VPSYSVKDWASQQSLQSISQYLVLLVQSSCLKEWEAAFLGSFQIFFDNLSHCASFVAAEIHAFGVG